MRQPQLPLARGNRGEVVKRWRRKGATAEGADAAEGRGITQTALVAVTTTNVWDKTEKMLHSLAVCKDAFELLVRGERIQAQSQCFNIC